MTRNPLVAQTPHTVRDVNARRVLAKLEATGRDIELIRLVANWEAGLRPFVLMSDALLFRGTLDPVVREIVVLDIAARGGHRYEWDEHVSISERAGVSAAQRSALQVASDDLTRHAELFDDGQLLAVAFSREIVERRTVDPDAWDRACEVLGRDAALELIFVVAWWAGFVPFVTDNLLALRQSPR